MLKKSGAHSELKLMLLPRNFRGNGHKKQFYLKRAWIFRISAKKKSSNLQIISLFTFSDIKEYHISLTGQLPLLDPLLIL